MRTLTEIVVLVTVLMSVVGCNSKLSTVDVSGSYQAVYPYGVEMLTLRTDGTYEQLFKYSDGKKIGNQGRWEFWTAAENTICLNNALVVDDGFGKPAVTAAIPQSGCRGIGARKNPLTGVVSLDVDEDLDIVFRKK